MNMNDMNSQSISFVLTATPQEEMTAMRFWISVIATIEQASCAS